MHDTYIAKGTHPLRPYAKTGDKFPHPKCNGGSVQPSTGILLETSRTERDERQEVLSDAGTDIEEMDKNQSKNEQSQTRDRKSTQEPGVC
ncbi:hypothetical protein Tco_0925811 [Tanacetum coccineum]|uniref:Uncharacterized protein n=1 Tax=Tanacetum coccineum TaxID=301880 RepID=A0ABQ5D976_9ASTR